MKMAVEKPIIDLSKQAVQIDGKRDTAKVKNEGDESNNSRVKRKRKRKQKGKVNSTVVIPGGSAVDKPDVKKRIDQPTSNPQFTCDDCNLVFPSYKSAIQHFKGKRHQLAIQANTSAKKESNTVRKRTNKANEYNPSKQTIDSSKVKRKVADVQEGTTKNTNELPKTMVVADQQVRCDDCNIDFISALSAIPHFKGKRHASEIAKKVRAQETQTISKRRGSTRPKETRNQRVIQSAKRWQSRGERAEALRNERRGMGSGYKNDYKRGDNGDGIKEDRDEQLLSAMKKYYSNPFYKNPRSNDVHNNPNPRSNDVRNNPNPRSNDVRNNPNPRSNDVRNNPNPRSNDVGNNSHETNESRNGMQSNDYHDNNSPPNHGTYEHQERNYQTQHRAYSCSNVEPPQGMYYDPKQPYDDYDRSISTITPRENFTRNNEDDDYNHTSTNYDNSNME